MHPVATALLEQLPPTRDWRLFWFAKLDQAIANGNLDAYAEAQRELARLGVDVRLKPTGVTSNGK